MEYNAGLLGDIECEVREVSIDILEEVNIFLIMLKFKNYKNIIFI